MVHQIVRLVDLLEQFDNPLVLLLLLSPECVNPLDGLLDLLVLSVEGPILLQPEHFVSQLLLCVFEVLVLGGQIFDALFQAFILEPQSVQFLTLLFHRSLYFLIDDFFNPTDVVSGIFKFLFVLVSLLE